MVAGFSRCGVAGEGILRQKRYKLVSRTPCRHQLKPERGRIERAATPSTVLQPNYTLCYILHRIALHFKPSLHLRYLNGLLFLNFKELVNRLNLHPTIKSLPSPPESGASVPLPPHPPARCGDDSRADWPSTPVRSHHVRCQVIAFLRHVFFVCVSLFTPRSRWRGNSSSWVVSRHNRWTE